MAWRLLTKVYIETLLKWRTGNPKCGLRKPRKRSQKPNKTNIVFSLYRLQQKDCGKQRCFALHNAEYFIQGHPCRTEIFKQPKYMCWMECHFEDTVRPVDSTLRKVLSHQLRNQQTYKLYINTVSVKSILGDRV